MAFPGPRTLWPGLMGTTVSPPSSSTPWAEGPVEVELGAGSWIRRYRQSWFSSERGSLQPQQPQQQPQQLLRRELLQQEAEPQPEQDGDPPRQQQDGDHPLQQLEDFQQQQLHQLTHFVHSVRSTLQWTGADGDPVDRALERLTEQLAALRRARCVIRLWERFSQFGVYTICILYLWTIAGWMQFSVSARQHAQQEKAAGQSFRCDHMIGTNYVVVFWFFVLLTVSPLSKCMTQECFLRTVCGYRPPPMDALVISTAIHVVPDVIRPGLPLRIKLLHGALLAGSLAWQVCGFFWASADDRCIQLHPPFVASVKALSIAIIIYTVVSQLAVPYVLQQMDLVGLSRVGPGRDDWRTPAQVMARCRVVDYDPQRFDGQDFPMECSICMSSFDATAPIRRTPCQHTFHEECLRKWVRRASSCPLCRLDLASSEGPPTLEPHPPPVALVAPADQPPPSQQQPLQQEQPLLRQQQE